MIMAVLLYDNAATCHAKARARVVCSSSDVPSVTSAAHLVATDCAWVAMSVLFSLSIEYLLIFLRIHCQGLCFSDRLH